MTAASDVRDPGTREGLRAEHDALAELLAVRTSIDWARKAFYQLFLGLISVGLTVKLGWDRWGALLPGVRRKAITGPPLFLWLAGAVAVVLLLLAIRSFVRARGLMREEDARWARYRELRSVLGLDA
jgi:heme exporter protein D